MPNRPIYCTAFIYLVLHTGVRIFFYRFCCILAFARKQNNIIQIQVGIVHKRSNHNSYNHNIVITYSINNTAFVLRET